jgi:hypothetical protein
MSVIRVGSSSKYADGWDAAFGGQRGAAKKSAAKKVAPAKKVAQAKAVAPAKKVVAGSKRSSTAVTKKVTAKPRKPSRSRRG